MKEKLETLTAFLEKYGYETCFSATIDSVAIICVGYLTRDAVCLFAKNTFVLQENGAMLGTIENVTVYLYPKL